ncbi:hypothetical protein [Legionella saoudiensis]|uniref:hypothetical protein n=1 Tax=Legionella saoudiensis TaxID=1750561 RepID=UPI000730E0D5|nr:hypothetical protein [Legionella saoudiensis]
MDFLRVLIAFVLVVFSTLIQADDNPGIAFIHGTGDHRVDAYGDYWKVDFIDRVTQGLANPGNYIVTHCNYNNYMWDEAAGECTVDQLLNFIHEKNISSLTVYTHSNGGNVLRWILSNPTYSNRYMELKKYIRRVVALAPSSTGTPLADLVLSGHIISSSLSWILGFNGDAIKQQRVGDMRIYNEELLLGTKGRPSLPVPFNPVIGTDVVASPLSSGSYCNGYLLNSGLKITKLYLDRCSDGFLNCSSQEAAGEIWFRDKERLENNWTLSHNQSRHSCFGLDKILISALATEGAVQ